MGVRGLLRLTGVLLYAAFPAATFASKGAIRVSEMSAVVPLLRMVEPSVVNS